MLAHFPWQLNLSQWSLETLHIRILRVHPGLGRESSKDMADNGENKTELSIAKKAT